MDTLLPVGKVSKLFGLDGGVLINLYDAFPDNMNIKEPLFVKIDGLAVPLFADRFERRGQKGALIRFEDIDSPVRASEFIGRELFLSHRNERGSADTPADDGELLIDELVGYRATVYEPEAELLWKGTVSAFIDDEFNPLLQLNINGKDVFIPAVDEFIDAIDTDSREISFIVPPGLIELYL